MENGFIEQIFESGGATFLAFNPMTVGKATEFFGVRELPKWYWPAFGVGVGMVV